MPATENSFIIVGFEGKTTSLRSYDILKRKNERRIGYDLFYYMGFRQYFPNGSESKELSQRMTQLTEQTKEYHQLITEWTPESAQGKEQFAEILTLQGKSQMAFHNVIVFNCFNFC